MYSFLCCSSEQQPLSSLGRRCSRVVHGMYSSCRALSRGHNRRGHNQSQPTHTLVFTFVCFGILRIHLYGSPPRLKETKSAVIVPSIDQSLPCRFLPFSTGSGSEYVSSGSAPSSSPTTKATPCRGRKRKQCARDGCFKRPSFARSGENPARCASHKLEHDVNVKHRQCVMPFCTLRCRFGIPGSKPVHCILHRQSGAIRFTALPAQLWVRPAPPTSVCSGREQVVSDRSNLPLTTKGMNCRQR